MIWSDKFYNYNESSKMNLFFFCCIFYCLGLYVNCFLLDHFFLSSFIVYLVSSKLFPHLLEGWIVIKFLFIFLGPFKFVFMLSFVQNISPIFLLKMLLDLFYIVVWDLQSVNGLNFLKVTYALIFWSSTSSSFEFTSFNLTSPVYIIASRSFFAFSKGTKSFLFPVYLKAGTLSAIFAYISLRSLFFELMKDLIESLAFFSLNLTSSTFSIWLTLLWTTSFLSYFYVLKQKNDPIGWYYNLLFDY